MTPRDLLDTLRRRGCVLTTDGSRLSVAGPDDVLTDAVVDDLARHKVDLIALLAEPPMETAGELIALWRDLGQPWVCDLWGGTIDDLPAWLEKTPADRWESVRWALSIWWKQRQQGRELRGAA